MSRLAAVALTLALSACTEKPQTATAAKPDAQAWQGAQAVYTAPGWTVGDKSSWELQIRNRNQGQNEYARTPVTQP